MASKPTPAHWQPPLPRELPPLREHLTDYLQSEPAYVFTMDALLRGRGTLRPDAAPEVGAALLLADEYKRLRHAQLFYVTADITKLVRQAAPSLRDKWDIQPQDLPAPTGFMLFAEPMTEYTRADGKRIDIVAASWGGTGLVTSRTGGLWVSFWSATDFAAAMKGIRDDEGVSLREAEILARRRYAELTWDNEIYLPWGAAPPTIDKSAPRVRTISPDTIAAAETTLTWLQTIHAGWIFCSPNTLTEAAEEHLPALNASAPSARGTRRHRSAWFRCDTEQRRSPRGEKSRPDAR